MTLYFDKRSELDDAIADIVRRELKDEHIDELMDHVSHCETYEEVRSKFREGLVRALRGDHP